MKLPDWLSAKLTPGISIFSSLAAMTFAVGAIGFVFAGMRDADQVGIEQQIVRSANKDALTKLGDALRNNTYWDNAYDQLTDKPDPEWTEKNLGPYALTTTGVSALFVLGDNNHVIYGYVDPKQKIAETEFETDVALLTLVQDAKARPGAPPGTAAGFVAVGGKLFLGAASLVVPNDDRGTGKLERHNVELYLKEFDSSAISKVQTDFHLSRVAVVNAPPSKEFAQIPLDDASGTTVAYLAWRPATPGRDFALTVAPYALFCIAFIGVLQWLGLTNWMATVRQLQQAREETVRLREESWSKTMFLANMSHELRTPLNAVIGFSEVMTQQMFGPVSNRYLDYAESIHSSGLHLLHIVDDVLDLTKLQNSSTGLDLDPVELATVLKSSGSILQEAARIQGIALSLALPETSAVVMSNTKALSQILMSLGSNAIKFTAKGGAVEIAAAYDAEAQRIRIDVKDNGCGIPKDKLPYLGQPFYHSESSFARQPGTGLGLALVKTLVARFEGTFVIESEQGRGTHVHVELPAPLFSPEPQQENIAA